MRPSKSRSRSKSNRQRSIGNIINRVFDSSGPEGKVRGTPQQIIDKYTQLARDAQLANDRVAAENFQQHAEHYTRLLGEAQREMDARREQHEGQQPQGGGNGNGFRDRPRDRAEGDLHRRDAVAEDMVERDDTGPAEVIDFVSDESGDEGESTLVETPEEKPAEKPRRPRRPRGGRSGGEARQAADSSDEAQAPAAE